VEKPGLSRGGLGFLFTQCKHQQLKFMKHDLSMLGRWVLCGLLFVSVNCLIAANFPIYGTIEVTRGQWYGFAMPITYAVPGTVQQYKEFQVPFGGSTTVSDSGSYQTSTQTINWNYTLVITMNLSNPNTAYIENTVNNWNGTQNTLEYYPIAGPACPDYSYSFYLTGSIMGTRYQVMKNPTNGDSVIIGEFTLGYGQTEHVQGVIEDFCGTVTVQKYTAGQENPWVDYVPPTTPPPTPPTPPLPSPPTPPTPPPTPPSEGGGSNGGVPPVNPPTPPPPAPPPVGGGGGDAEVIEWAKDSNTVQRGISDRVDNANEYLRQIKDNTAYTAERAETMDENLQVIADDVVRKQEVEQAAIEATPNTSAMLIAGNAAAEGIQGAMGALTYETPEPSTSTPAFTWAVAGSTWSFNPFSVDLIETFASWVKSLIAWMMGYYFFRWAMDQVKDARRHVEIAPQTRGNTVAGTGGQLSAFIGAGLITAVVLSMSLVIYGMWRDKTVGTTNLAGLFSGTPFTGQSGTVAQGLWVLDQFFPIATALSVMISYMTFAFQAEVATASAVAIKRFINP